MQTEIHLYFNCIDLISHGIKINRTTFCLFILHEIFFLDFSCQTSTIDDLYLHMWLWCSYIESKKEHWYPAPTVIIKEMEDLTRLRVAVWAQHRMNFQDIVERFARRSLLLEEMVKMFKELDIQYRLYPLDINVRSIPEFSSSDRMPPTWGTPPTS